MWFVMVFFLIRLNNTTDGDIIPVKTYNIVQEVIFVSWKLHRAAVFP